VRDAATQQKRFDSDTPNRRADARGKALGEGTSSHLSPQPCGGLRPAA